MTLLDQRFTPPINSDTHDLLNDRARVLTLGKISTLENYIDAHAAIRDDMLRASYPSIDDERTTMRFILKGLSTHPVLKHQVPALTRLNLASMVSPSEWLSRPPVPLAPERASQADYSTLYCHFHRGVGLLTTRRAHPNVGVTGWIFLSWFTFNVWT